jgi:hypothetical protein
MIRHAGWLLAAPAIIVLAAVSWSLLLLAGVVGFGTGFFWVRKQRDDAEAALTDLMELQLADAVDGYVVAQQRNDELRRVTDDEFFAQLYRETNSPVHDELAVERLRAELDGWGDRGGLA